MNTPPNGDNGCTTTPAPAAPMVPRDSHNTEHATSSVAPAPAAPSSHPLSHLPIPFQAVDFTLKGYHLDAGIAPNQVVSVAEQLDREGFALDTITGVDWLTAVELEVVYDYFHPHKFLRVVVRTRVSREKPEVPTISKVFPGANWHEREAHDFFGIRFLGHPNLLPFLLPEDAAYHPLRKDFTTC